MIRVKVVAGPVQIGAGAVVRLSEGQYVPRAHNVDVIRRSGKGGGETIDVRAKVPLDFKTGETLGLAELPKHLADRLEDLDAEAKAVAAAAEAKRKADEAAAAEAKRKADEAAAAEAARKAAGGGS